MDDVTIDFSDAENAVTTAFREMAALTGMPIQKIIRAEAGSILKECAGKTKVANPQKVEVGARNGALRALGLTSDREGSDITINSGRRGPVGRIWARSTGPRSRRRWRAAYGAGNPVGQPVNTHWKRSDWTDIQEAKADYERELEKVMPRALNSIGLGRQSWLQIADALGIRLEEVPGGRISAQGLAKARKALDREGRPHTNGTAVELGSADEYLAVLINRLPYAARLDFPRILGMAMAGRANYFMQSLNHGVFDSMKAVAARYPGFQVEIGAN